MSRLLPVDPTTPGAGAAGGTGFSLLAWGARLTSGASEIARLVGLSETIATATWVITGEGSFDHQTASGKAPAYVRGVAGAAGVPTALVAGRIAPDADTSDFVATVSLTRLAGSAVAALADPGRWLRVAGGRLAALCS